MRTKDQAGFTIAMPIDKLKKVDAWIANLSKKTGIKLSRNAGINAMIETVLKKGINEKRSK